MPSEDEPSGVLPLLEPDDEPAYGKVPRPPGPPPGAPPPFGGSPPGPPPGAPPGLGVAGPPGGPRLRDPASARLAESLSQVATDMDSISLVDLDGTGEGGAPLEAALTAGEAPASPAAQPSATPSVDLAPGGADDVLELDLEKAGLTKKPQGMSAPGQEARPAAPVDEPPPPALPDPVAPKAASGPSPASQSMAGRASPSPPPEKVRLLGEDQILAGLAAAAIGLVLGLFVANEVASRVERDQVEPLYAELEQAVTRPLAARAGEIRTSAVVKADLREGQSEARSSFLTYWFLTALPVAGGLFFIRRPG